MNKKKNAPRYEIGLRILVPLIVGGATFIAVMSILSSDILQHFKSIANQTLFTATVAGTISLLGSGIAVSIFLRPISQFMKEAQAGLEHTRPPEKQRTRVDLEQFERVSQQVTQVLNKLDAKAYFPDFKGESRALRGLLKQVLEVAGSNATVLITGESGTGKELVAQGVHAQSRRAEKPFIAINCAAIASGILESELFGHEKGAFTGAIANKKGKFELAHGGTLFLDEIGDMPMETQAKILRVIETGCVERVGGVKTHHIDVRIVAATNHDLKSKIQRGEFREDLFHRLNVFPILVPPLRERREDIPALADFFLEKAEKSQTLSAEALALLMTYDYPGNVRELKNIVERSSVRASVQTAIAPDILPEEIVGSLLPHTTPQLETFSTSSTNLDAKLAAYEKGLIEAALSQTQGIQNTAAELLGIKPRSLWHRVKKHGIEPTSFK
ncbi:sigma-54 interaction domain-containing protein [Desulfovibrio inopinatus]|uniref:sigma-54 interaction domain-containing protein n=1 Tax=Desulfovibrio inopinatus TaxID=102109 RepID=UPI00040CFF6A|nr:sigma-54 dependent transcriptional regulator [Desulfovibrio inopinatus]